MTNQKAEWHYFSETYNIVEENRKKQIPVTVFINKKTGELKLFSEYIVKKIGTDNLEL